MGLFGKLFDKKECAICGGEIGLLGNRKLEDGNLCKNCAARLSPWFSERRHSTVREIEEQLAYREANYARVRAFVPTRHFGEDGCLFMDDNMQAFTVTSVNGLSNGNPDIVDYSAYVSIKPDIIEHKWEDHDGPKEEGRPPRFKFDYDFYITVYVNHPYFDDMRFQLNRTAVKQIDFEECMRFVRMTEDAVEAMSGTRPDLKGSIRPFEPEPRPIPIPIPVPHMNAAPAPQPRAPQGAPAPQPRAPQGAPAPQPRAPQGAPAPQSRAAQGAPSQQFRAAQGNFTAQRDPAPQSRIPQGGQMPQPQRPQDHGNARQVSAPQSRTPQSRTPQEQSRGTSQPAHPQQGRPSANNAGFSGAGRQSQASPSRQNEGRPGGHGGEGPVRGNGPAGGRR